MEQSGFWVEVCNQWFYFNREPEADLLISTSLCFTPFSTIRGPLFHPVLKQAVPKTEIRRSGGYEDNSREADSS